MHPEQQRDEFALPGRPYQIGQGGAALLFQNQTPLERRTVGAQSESAEDVIDDRLSQGLRQTLSARKDDVIRTDFVLHHFVKFLAEVAQDVRIPDR